MNLFAFTAFFVLTNHDAARCGLKARAVFLTTTAMNRNYYSPICRRADGSVYIEKNRFLKEFFGGAAAVLLLALLFTAIAMFALLAPSVTESPRDENAHRAGEVSEVRLADAKK